MAQGSKEVEEALAAAVTAVEGAKVPKDPGRRLSVRRSMAGLDPQETGPPGTSQAHCCLSLTEILRRGSKKLQAGSKSRLLRQKWCTTSMRMVSI